MGSPTLAAALDNHIPPAVPATAAGHISAGTGTSNQIVVFVLAPRTNCVRCGSKLRQRPCGCHVGPDLGRRCDDGNPHQPESGTQPETCPTPAATGYDPAVAAARFGEPA